MDDINYRLIMLHLKRQLRRRNFRYSDLSAGLRVPESTLQKWFAASDGSYNRINLICKFLGITLKDVLSALEREPTNDFEFAEAQQALFEKDYINFVAFWLLAYERLPVETVAHRLGLDQSRMKGLLTRLDRARLVNLLPGDRLRLPSLRPVRWKATGKFIRNTFRDWSMGILKEALAQNSGSGLVVQYFQLTDSSFDDLMKDIRELEEKYGRRTVQELRSGAKNLRGVRFLLSHATGSFFKKIPVD